MGLPSDTVLASLSGSGLFVTYIAEREAALGADGKASSGAVAPPSVVA